MHGRCQQFSPYINTGITQDQWAPYRYEATKSTLVDAFEDSGIELEGVRSETELVDRLRRSSPARIRQST